MQNKNIYLLIVSLCVITLSGCSSNYGVRTANDSAGTEKNTITCEKTDPVNTSLLASGITGLITFNPVATLVVGGVSYFTVNTGIFDFKLDDK